jgi:hypothetical protein
VSAAPRFRADVLQAVDDYRVALRALLEAELAVRAAKDRRIASVTERAEVKAADARTAVTEARLALDAVLAD